MFPDYLLLINLFYLRVNYGFCKPMLSQVHSSWERGGVFFTGAVTY